MTENTTVRDQNLDREYHTNRTGVDDGPCHDKPIDMHTASGLAVVNLFSTPLNKRFAFVHH